MRRFVPYIVPRIVHAPKQCFYMLFKILFATHDNNLSERGDSIIAMFWLMNIDPHVQKTSKN